MKGVAQVVAAGAMVASLGTSAFAFQESSVGGGPEKPAAGVVELELPKSSGGDAGKGLSLTVPQLSIGKDTGTEIRIPGVGPLGVLPKLDFGLEMLYGATDSSGRPDEKSQPSDMQLRATIKHRF
jgi:hypothetical protein